MFKQDAMNTQNEPENKNIPDAAVSQHGEAPPDPSNTSNIGQPTEQGVISKKEGITEQSSTWENEADSNIPGEGDNSVDKQVENYIKHPSPEDANNDIDSDEEI